MWIWAIEVATLFLILISVTMRVWEESDKEAIVKLLSWQDQDLRFSSLLFLKEWKEKWLEKESIILKPEENSLLNRLNTGNILLNLLSISMTEPLIINHWYGMSESKEKWWGSILSESFDSSNDLKMWLSESKWALSWALPLSLQICRWIETRPAIALIPKEREIWKVPKIQITTLLCIFFSSLRE